MMTVLYPEKKLRAETNKSSASSIPVRGENTQSVMNQKTTEGLDCKFKSVSEYKRQNSLGAPLGTEKSLFLFKRQLDLENSDAQFKDSMLS